MRVYFDSQNIQGTPIKSDIITLKDFAFIIEHKGENNLPLDQPKSRFFNFLLPDNSVFKHAYILKENFSWSDYFLPNNIIFHDHEINRVAYFVGAFYFISQIGDNLELRCFINDDNNLSYQSVSKMHREVTDHKIIKKIERSFQQLLKQKLIEPNIEKVVVEEPLPVIPSFSLDNEALNSFLLLIENKVSKKLLTDLNKIAGDTTQFFIDNKNFFDDYGIDEPFDKLYLHYLIGKLQNKKKLFTVDWKVEYEDLAHFIKKLTPVELDEKFNDDYFAKSASDEMLTSINQIVQSKSDNTLFVIDTESDSSTFGIIPKEHYSKLIEYGKRIDINIIIP